MNSVSCEYVFGLTSRANHVFLVHTCKKGEKFLINSNVFSVFHFNDLKISYRIKRISSLDFINYDDNYSVISFPSNSPLFTHSTCVFSSSTNRSKINASSNLIKQFIVDRRTQFTYTFPISKYNGPREIRADSM